MLWVAHKVFVRWTLSGAAVEKEPIVLEVLRQSLQTRGMATEMRLDGAPAVLLVELLDGADGAVAHVARDELRIASVLPHPLQKGLLVRLLHNQPHDG